MLSFRPDRSLPIRRICFPLTGCARHIQALRQEYKFIVIDSPPVMAATDAVILSVLVDGVLLVVRSGETPKGAFKRMRDLLGGMKCHLLGVLLNAVDSGRPIIIIRTAIIRIQTKGMATIEKNKKEG